MNTWMNGIFQLILDRPLEDLFGAILLALALSAIGAAVGVRLCRSRRDEVSRMTAVTLVVALVSMAIAGTGIEVRHNQELQRPTAIASSMPPPPIGPNHASAPNPYFQMVKILDTDRDGHVSRSEMKQAAEALGTETDFHPAGPHPRGAWTSRPDSPHTERARRIGRN